MQTRRFYSLPQTLWWSKNHILWPALYSTAVVGLREGMELDAIEIPFALVSFAGVAVAFFVGFKNNASYARLWEARQIWGGIVNTSRAFGMAARDLVGSQPAETDMAVHRELILRHIAWLTALRHQLRRTQPWEHVGSADEAMRALTAERRSTVEKDLAPLLPERELAAVLSKTNRAAQILALQSGRLKQLRGEGLLDDFRHVALQQILTDLVAEQGRSERLKNFPFPRQYASFTRYSVQLLCALLPFGMLGVLDETSPVAIWRIGAAVLGVPDR